MSNLNTIKALDAANGKYFVLADYISEGLGVVDSFDSFDDAVACVARNDTSADTSIVKLVEHTITEVEP